MVILEAIYSDVTHGSEDAQFNINTKIAGTNRSRIEMTPTETVFNEDTVDLDFRVESNNDTHALFVQGSNGYVGMSMATPVTYLDIKKTDGADEGIGVIRVLTTNGGTIATDMGGQINFSYQWENSGSLLANSPYIKAVKTNANEEYGGGLAFGTRVQGSSQAERLRITDDGKVGIGKVPTKAFEMYQDFAGHIARFHNDGNAAGRYGIICQIGTDDNSGTNYHHIMADGDGSEVGYITSSSGTVSYGAFTAHHDAELPDADNENGYPYGTLVETTEIFYQKHKDGSEYERGIRYKVQKTSSAYSKSVLGAYGGKHENIAEFEVLYQDGDDLPAGKSIGDVKTEAVLSDKENLHLVGILGDGHILCKGEKGNILMGDGICTSSTDGEGMKADKMAMIIGIAQEDVSFSGSESKLVAVQYGLQQFTPWDD